MKTLIAVIAAAAIGLATGYFTVQRTAKQQAALAAKEKETLQTKWAEEKALLEHQLKVTRTRTAKSENGPSTHPTGTGNRSPEQILESLKSLKVTGGSGRNQSIRRVVHHLESLAEHGEAALPVIRQFLSQFEDANYGTVAASTTESPAGREGEPPVPGGAPKPEAKLDFLYPPSLRLGLIDVVQTIGGPTAESILANVLSTTGRAVEVAYVARALQEMAPNKYKDTAIAAAKELLANPPKIDQPNRLDENAKNYLYIVLAMYNDQSFSSVAHALLITAQGQLDRNALTYLTSTLKENAVPALYQAYKDPRLTNLWEKASIAGQALSYAGANPQADQLFKEVIGNESMPSWMRAMSIQTLAGGTFFGGNVPADPKQIQARLDLLNNLGDLRDERMAEAKADAIKRLTERLNTEPAPVPAEAPITAPTEPEAPVADEPVEPIEPGQGPE